MSTRWPSRPVVVGVDGSHAAVAAALWAVNEALRHDVPLRLMCVVDGDDDTDSAAHDLASARSRYASASWQSRRAGHRSRSKRRSGRATRPRCSSRLPPRHSCCASGATGQEHTPGVALRPDRRIDQRGALSGCRHPPPTAPHSTHQQWSPRSMTRAISPQFWNTGSRKRGGAGTPPCPSWRPGSRDSPTFTTPRPGRPATVAPVPGSSANLTGYGVNTPPI